MHETLFSEKELLEAQTPRQLAKYILEQSEKINEAERLMNLANIVLGQYGTTIERELDNIKSETEITNT